MPSKITQIDVAKAAKVSTGTVSRVINNHPFVSESARAAVLEAIKKLGYTPNTIAQSLAYGRSKNILILFLDKQPILPSTWQYELPILQGINDSLKDHAYSLQIEMLTLGLENSQPAFDMMMSKSSFDGLIVLTSWNVEDQFLCRITERGIPTTFIGNGPYQIDGNPVGSTVLFDNSNIVKEVYTFLRSLGHRRIAFIKGTSDQLHAQIRLQAFTEISREYNQEPLAGYLYDGDYSVNSGYDAVSSFFRNDPPPTAIICANDLMAIGAMKAASELGLRVPDDLSIVGFDDIEVSGFLSPSLSTVKVPSYDLGILAAKALIGSIEERKPNVVYSLPTKFLIRKSVSKPTPGAKQENQATRIS